MDVIESEVVIKCENNTTEDDAFNNDDDDDRNRPDPNGSQQANEDQLEDGLLQQTNNGDDDDDQEIEQHRQRLSTADVAVEQKNDFDKFVDKVYGKILDMAKDKNLIQQNAFQTCDSEISIDEENRRAYPAQNILTSNAILYGILKHTCLNCSKSFEHAKSLRRHFLLEHIVYKPTYACKQCELSRNTTAHDNLFDLDKYLVHLLTKHNNLDDLLNLYDLFILKYIQDIFTDFLSEGKFYLDPQQIKHINKLKFGKENCTLIQKMHSKIYENYFINDDCDVTTCKPPVTLTSKSLKSNLLYSQITKAQVFKEIYEYLKIDTQSMTEDALTAYLTIKQAQQQQPPALSATDNDDHVLQQQQQQHAQYHMDNYKYNQCKFCMKIFKECNAYKEHVMEAHTFNEFCNRCIVCPYCKQVLKSNFDKNADANVLLTVHIKKCMALKSDLSHVYNTFRYTSDLSTLQTALDLPPVDYPQEPVDNYEEQMVSYEILNTDVDIKRVYNKQSKKRSDANEDKPPTKKKLKAAKLPIVIKEKPQQVVDNGLACYLCDYKTSANDTAIKQSIMIEAHLIDDHCILKCALCECETLKKAYIDHLNSVHIPECTEICYLCPYTVQISEECKQHLNLTEFLQHMCVSSKMSEYRDSYKCPICDKVLKTTSNDNPNDMDDFEVLSQHFQHVHSISMYNCELCTASFRDGWCLVEHILCEHKPMNMDNTEFNDDGASVHDKYLKCFKCMKTIKYASMQVVKLHELECMYGANGASIRNGVKTAMQRNSHHNNDVSTNSNLFINPLSILSNVSTSVPHILSSSSSSAATGGEQRTSNEYFAKNVMDDDCLLPNEHTNTSTTTTTMIKLEEDNHHFAVDAHLGLRSPPHVIDETIIETIAEQVEI